jgi:hypothetical protein
MFKNKKNINAGDGSTNIQGQIVNVTKNEGIDYIQARQIAIDVFKANMYELSEVAKKVATDRAETLVEKFLQSMKGEFGNKLDKIQNPDVQYSLVNAQKQYARSGEEHNLNILIEMLSNRFQVEEGSLKSLVLNEAIEVNSKLTHNQIRVISMLFIVKIVHFINVEYNMDIIFDVLKDLINDTNFSSDNSFYQHLVYAGVALRDDTTNSGHDLEFHLWKSYEAKRESPRDLEKFKTEINSSKSRKFIINTWNSSNIKWYTLTSVGYAIAIAYINASLSTSMKLSNFISD